MGYKNVLFMKASKPTPINPKDYEVGPFGEIINSVQDCAFRSSADHPNTAVVHPSHYCKGGVECIAAIKASMTEEAFKGYLKGNTMKYIYRYESKEKPLEDLQKAKVYLEWLIKEVQNGIDAGTDCVDSGGCVEKN